MRDPEMKRGICQCCGREKNVKLMTFTYYWVSQEMAKMPEQDWLCISCILDAPPTVRWQQKQ